MTPDELDADYRRAIECDDLRDDRKAAAQKKIRTWPNVRVGFNPLVPFRPEVKKPAK